MPQIHSARSLRRAVLANLTLALAWAPSCASKTTAPPVSAATPSEQSAAYSPRENTAAAKGEAVEREARRRARDWLALVDGRRYAESWDMAADIFQSVTSQKQWQRAAERARMPLGELTRREFRAAQFESSLPGAPTGEYVVVHYETAFTNKTVAREIVTLALGSDNAWKVAGYFVQ